MRVLFICHKNETYGFSTYTRRSSGLFNSTRFIVEGLAARGVHAHIVEVVDNNCIDREVTKFRPHVVIIEALWVVPEKFRILHKLHPKVKWFCHMHSGMPFLAMEGIAMDWLLRYPWEGVGIIANSVDSHEALKNLYRPGFEGLHFLPNVYIGKPRSMPLDSCGTELNVGCFGAVRPLKNQLLQALAALKFAREHGKHLRFHINGSRSETGGDPVLKNLRQLFAHKHHTHPSAELVEHRWMEPDEFLDCLRIMDICMQVSLTETFNVVSADYVTAGVPIVVSKEVSWASMFNKASDSSADDIVKVMNRVWRSRILVRRNQYLLQMFSQSAQEAWFNFIKKQHEV